MTSPSNTMPESLDSQRIAPAALSATQPLYWAIRRELWENRYLYIAPLAVAALFLFGFLISLIGLRHRMHTLSGLDPAQQHEAVARPYEIAAGLIMGAAFIVALYYCVEALHGERRDRSILFWKSLPVSDLTTVLAKMSIPVAMQLLAWVITAITYLIMLLLSSAVLLASGQSVATLGRQLSLFQMSLMLLYHFVTVHALWYAPIYAWLLLVSAWARRAAFLWVILPPLAIYFVEKIAFNTWHFANWLGYRFSGPEAFTFSAHGGSPMDPMTTPDPAKFLSTPGLWIGLVFAAVFLAAAARLRRYREPI
jgi:ABC-2 type transport system permease protein